MQTRVTYDEMKQKLDELFKSYRHGNKIFPAGLWAKAHADTSRFVSKSLEKAEKGAERFPDEHREAYKIFALTHHVMALLGYLDARKSKDLRTELEAYEAKFNTEFVKSINNTDIPAFSTALSGVLQNLNPKDEKLCEQQAEAVVKHLPKAYAAAKGLTARPVTPGMKP